MTLRPAELLQVALEVSQVLRGRSLQKVAQPDDHTVVLGFPRAWLLVSLDPRRGRVHLVNEKPVTAEEPRAAPPFCMLLRKHLVGTRLEAVEAVAGERACALEFARDGARRRLLLFLYGAGARLVLVNEEGRPLGSLGARTRVAEERVELPPPRGDASASRFAGPAPSEQIASFYGEAEVKARSEALRATAMAAARKYLAQVRQREEALAQDLARVEEAASYRRDADLLLAHLAEVPRGAGEVRLPDHFSDGAPVTIRLDPARSPQDNAAQLYRRYKRLQRGRQTVEGRLAAARAERGRAEEYLAALAAASDEALGALTLPSRRPGGAGKGGARSAASPRTRRAGSEPYRVFRSASGAEILVGKGAARNDELTFRVARGNDLWLHTRDFAGSHVVVPLAGRPADEATLLDAATLAAWFSGARDRDQPAAEARLQADVTYALRKYVRKPKGAAPGRVSIAGGKTLRVRVEPERLARLLASRSDD